MTIELVGVPDVGNRGRVVLSSTLRKKGKKSKPKIKGKKKKDCGCDA